MAESDMASIYNIYKSYDFLNCIINTNLQFLMSKIQMEM